MPTRRGIFRGLVIAILLVVAVAAVAVLNGIRLLEAARRQDRELRVSGLLRDVRTHLAELER
ncbi:MAG: hypothetical protein WCC53_17130, partial [Thermoanaerobaculia bacterium]